MHLRENALMSCVSDIETEPVQSQCTSVLSVLEEFLIQKLLLPIMSLKNGKEGMMY